MKKYTPAEIATGLVILVAIFGGMYYWTRPAPIASGGQTEQKMIKIVDHYRAAWKANTNGMEDQDIRAERAKAICDLFRKGIVGNFVGKVSDVGLADLPDMTKRINAYLSIKLSPHLTVETYKNDPLNKGQYMIAPGTALYTETKKLQVGETVVIGGTFVRDRKDCFRELSATESGGMTAPEFLFRFTEVDPHQEN